jgi:hypothetical protein
MLLTLGGALAGLSFAGFLRDRETRATDQSRDCDRDH